MREGTLTLGGDRPRNDVLAKGDKRDGNAAPMGARSTPWGVLVRSTNAGEPKIERGKGIPLGTKRHGHV